MTDTQAKCFLMAAKYENFTKAAEILFMAQPVLGRHISNLEEELGFALFERSRKTVRLTENGRLFELFLKRTEQEYNSMIRKVREKLRTNSMDLKIGAVEGQRVENYFAPVLKHIIENGGFIRVSVEYFGNSDMLLAALNDGETDVAIIEEEVVENYGHVFGMKYICTTLGCLIVPSFGKSEPKPEDYTNLPYILRSEGDNKISRDLQIEIAECFGFTNFVTVPNLATLAMLVKSGVGVTAVPENQEICYEPGVCRIYHRNPHRFDEVLAWRKDNGNPAVKAFCDVMDKTGKYKTEKQGRADIG